MAERAAVSLDNRTSTKKTSESATATAIGQPVASVSAAAAIDVAHSFETAFRRDLAIPLHVQHVQRALNLKPIVDFVETMFGENVRPRFVRKKGPRLPFSMCFLFFLSRTA